MASPSKLWTDVIDGRIDGDSPVTEKLFADLRDNLIYLREYIGGSFIGEVDHNHDGLNSAPVGNSEWQSLDLSDHFFGGAAYLNRWWLWNWDPTAEKLPPGPVFSATEDVIKLYAAQHQIMSQQRVKLQTRSVRLAFRIAFDTWANCSTLRFGMEVPAVSLANVLLVERGTNTGTLRFRTGEAGDLTITDNLGVAQGIVFGASAWNDVVIENWTDTSLAPDGQKESILYLNGVKVATHRVDQGHYVPGATTNVVAAVVAWPNCWIDSIRTTTPPTKKLNTFPLV